MVENFSPGAMDRFKVGYAQLKATDPKVILCSIFRIRADRADDFCTPAYDIVAQALGGTMSVTRKSRRWAGAIPGDVGRQDLSAALYGVIVIVSALRVRDRDGVGNPRRCRDARVRSRCSRTRSRATQDVGQDSGKDRHAPSVDHAVPTVPRGGRLLA